MIRSYGVSDSGAVRHKNEDCFVADDRLSLFVVADGMGGHAAGEVASPPLYPKSTAYGIDASLSVGYRVTSLIGLRVGGDFRQIGLATHWTSANTALQTGGALDRYISGWGGVEVVLDAVGGGPGRGDEEAPPAKKAPAKARKAAPQDVEPEETPDGGDSKPKGGDDE